MVKIDKHFFCVGKYAIGYRRPRTCLARWRGWLFHLPTTWVDKGCVIVLGLEVAWGRN